MGQERARDRDRDAGAELVRRAYAAGRIVAPDRDRRLEELRHAQTLSEIDLLTRDLRLADPLAQPGHPMPAPSMPVQAIPAPSMPVPPMPVQAPPAQQAQQIHAVGPTPYGPPAGSGVPLRAPGPRRSPAVLGCLVPLVVGIVVLAGLGLVVTALVGTTAEIVGTGVREAQPIYAPGEEPAGDDVNVLSTSGYADLLEALRGTRFGTTAFLASLYPDRATIHVPVDDSSQRETLLLWDGELEAQDYTNRSSFRRFDLATVDPAVVVRGVKRAMAMVDEPTTWYAIVRAPDDDGAVVWAYATNEYNETAYLGLTRAGQVTYRSAPTG